MDRQLPRQTLCYGSVTALQQSYQSIGKLLAQGIVNPLGVDMIAAFNAVNRVNGSASTPEQSVSHGITTLVVQNRGADRKGHIQKGLERGPMLEVCYWVSICITITLFRRPFMGLFVATGNEGTMVLGNSYPGMVALFYVLPAFTNGIQGLFRGMGKMNVTLLGTSVQTSLGVVFVYLLTPGIELPGVARACVIGWSVMLSIEALYYFWFMRDK